MLWGVITITFVLGHLVPGDITNVIHDPWLTPERIDAMRRRFGIDQPWWIQYGLYLRNVLLLDFGDSFTFPRPVFAVLRDGLFNTLWLQATALLISWGVAIPLGVWAARRANTWADRSVAFGASLALAVPEMVSGLLLIYFAARSGFFPVGGMRSPHWDTLPAGGQALDLVWHVALPALVLAFAPLAVYLRQTRGNLLDVLRRDYVTTARAKGLDEQAVAFKHALPNALNPLISLFGFSLAALISGSFIVEILFSWPGVGRTTFVALVTEDQYLAMGGVLMVSAMLVLGNLVADLLLAVVDPRIVHD